MISNITVFFLPFQLWHRLLLVGDNFAAALVHMWQLFKQAKSLSVASIPMLYRIVRNFGSKKLWRNGVFEILSKKTLANPKGLH